MINFQARGTVKEQINPPSIDNTQLCIINLVPSVTLAKAKYWADQANNFGGNLIFLTHDFDDAMPATTYWGTTNYYALVDYVASIGATVVNANQLREFYQK